jgi:hypothetical protein
MFLTSAEPRHLRTLLHFPGHLVWNVVQVPLANPLVISRIACPLPGEGEPAYRTYISEMGVFAAMAVQPKTRVVCAELLLPPEFSGSAHWQLQQVQEVWECQEPDNPQMHCCILRTSHAEHSDSVCGTAAADLKKRRLLYQVPAESAKCSSTSTRAPRQGTS